MDEDRDERCNCVECKLRKDFESGFQNIHSSALKENPKLVEDFPAPGEFQAYYDALRQSIDPLYDLKGDRHRIKIRAHHHMIDDIYRSLTALDTKSANLLTVNSIAFAALTALAIAYVESDIFGSYKLHAVIILFTTPLFLLSLSSSNLFKVIRVRWSSAEDIKANLPPYNLIKSRMERTISYRRALSTSKHGFFGVVVNMGIYLMMFSALKHVHE